jgi:hypothetical protein
VVSHEAWGLSIYSVFIDPDIVLSRAIEAPRSVNIKFHDMITVSVGDHGAISDVIDDTGGATAIYPSPGSRLN